MVEAFVLDGRVALVALGVLTIELLFLLAFHRRPSAPALLANGLAGIFLIMALRAALLGPDAKEIAVWLGLGLIAHVGDLVLRLRR